MNIPEFYWQELITPLNYRSKVTVLKCLRPNRESRVPQSSDQFKPVQLTLPPTRQNGCLKRLVTKSMYV